MKFTTHTLLGATLAATVFGAQAQDNLIRQNLAQRIPELRTIDEVSKTAIPGLFEVRVNGTEIYYTDAQANYLFMGHLVDTRTQRNLTQERLNKLTAIEFDKLPAKDAFTIVRGNGQRKLAVFEDPNCGYCKRFERDLQQVNNVTIYLYLLPILGADSTEKSKAIWCAKDPAKTWLDYMVRNQPPPAAPSGCDFSALQRNVEFGRTYRITGTPTLFFANGTRVPGAVNAQQVETHLSQASKP